MACLASSGLVGPHRASSCRRASPSLAAASLALVGGLAVPHRVSPCFDVPCCRCASPSRGSSDLIAPRRASPCRASSRLVVLRQARPIPRRASPCLAAPPCASSCLAIPRRASPCLASSCLVAPHRASSLFVVPCRAVLGRTPPTSQTDRWRPYSLPCWGCGRNSNEGFGSCLQLLKPLKIPEMFQRSVEAAALPGHPGGAVVSSPGSGSGPGRRSSPSGRSGRSRNPRARR